MQAEKNRKEMLKLYQNYPLVGDYDIDFDILDSEMLELININWDKEDC